MADVTLEDLQRVNTKIAAVEASVKEALRLLKIQDEFGSESFKRVSDESIALKNSVKTLEKRLGDLEKKVKK